MIDRIAPAQRPAGDAVMHIAWRHLLFLHWEVPASQLLPHIPASLELDTYEGRAYVGLVAFTMRNAVPPVFLKTPLYPRSWHHYHEVNVRTYVHRGGKEPGVLFFSLDAANLPAVIAARAWYRLPYHYARMGLRQERQSTMQFISRRLWPGRRHAGCRLRATIHGEAGAALPGSLDHFLVERYILYTCSGQNLYEGRVHHTPYPVQAATLHEWREDLTKAAGIARPSTAPLVHYAAGVDTSVFPLRRLP